MAVLQHNLTCGRGVRPVLVETAARAFLLLALPALVLEGGCATAPKVAAVEKGRIILSDPLNGSTVGNLQGGRFVEGGGWTVTTRHDRIIWDLPAMPPDGMLELDVRNFDPPHQVSTEKSNFLGLWGRLFDNLEKLNVPDTDSVDLRMGTCCKQFRVEYHSRGVGKAATWEPIQGSFDPKHTYHFKIEWKGGQVTIWLDENKLFFEGFAHEPVDRFSFLHLGTSPHFGGDPTLGPIYSNVKVTAFETSK